MSRPRRSQALRWGSLALGVVLFLIALSYIGFGSALAIVRQLGLALPLALLLSGLWHVVRTFAWARCFPKQRQVGFLRLARVRLYAEAFSYLTLRGIAGEPLKVLLLADSIDPREVTAALALERIAYLVGTTLIVGAASLLAIATVPLSAGWLRVFIAFAIASVTIGADRGRRCGARHRLCTEPAAPARSCRRHVVLGQRRRTVSHRRRASDARVGPWQRQTAGIPCRCNDLRLWLHGARSMGPPGRRGRAHHWNRCAGGREFYA